MAEKYLTSKSVSEDSCVKALEIAESRELFLTEGSTSFSPLATLNRILGTLSAVWLRKNGTIVFSMQVCDKYGIRRGIANSGVIRNR